MAGIDFTTKSVPIGFIKNSGGLNSTASPIGVQDNEASDLQNIDFDRFGAFRQRNGSTLLNTTAANSGASCTSLHYFENKSTDVLLGTFGNALFKMEALDGTWDDITGGLTITAGDTNLFSWVTFNNAAYGTNGVDLPIKVDSALSSSNFTVPTGLTKAKYIETFENYAFLANCTVSGTARPTRLYWSSIDDAETWDAADFVELGLDDGEDITGLNKLGDRIVIYKERSVYVGLFTGDADIPFVFKKTPSEVGCVSHWSIQEARNAQFFLSVDGIYLFDGFNSTKISDRITTTLQNLNSNRNSFAVGLYQKTKNKYWLSLSSTSGGHDRIITFDLFNNAFSIYTGLEANAITLLNFSGDERVYLGDYDGFCRRADVPNINDDKDTSNNNVAIQSFYKTKWFDFGDVVLQKGTAHSVFYYDFANTTLTIAYSYDLEEGNDITQTFDISQGGAEWDSAIWDVDEWVKGGGSFKRVDHKGRGRLMRMVFQNLNEGETFKINAFGVLVHLETHT